MGYLDSMSWEQLKKELQSELEKGLAVLKNGAVVVQKKAEELTAEGKRQYKMLVIKAKIHDAMRDLGAKVYLLMGGRRATNPLLNADVRETAAKIKGLEEDLAKLEGKAAKKPAPRTAGRRAANVRARARRKAQTAGR
ncbi:MAG TPA: hypothetical protein VK654_02890 [Nitrospirota bacterium]|nr:hypothetical protein [Nitrospirota bacterium]